MKNFGDIDSKFRYVIVAALRAKQLLAGAKPRLKSKSKNLIRIAQEEVKQGLVEFEIVTTAREEMDEMTDKHEEMVFGAEVTPKVKEKPEKKAKKEKPAAKRKKS